MKSHLLLVSFIAFSFIAEAQFLSSGLKVAFGYEYSLPGDEKIISQNLLMTPSAFGNLEHWQGFHIKIHMELNPFLSVGGAFNNLTSGNWNYSPMNDYQGMTINQSLFSIPVRLHTPHQREGLLNKLSFFAEVAPSAGVNRIDMQIPFMFNDNPYYYTGIVPDNVRNTIYGTRLMLGTGFILNYIIGVSAACFYDYYLTGSNFYSDTKFSRLGIEASLFLRFQLNKKYYL